MFFSSTSSFSTSSSTSTYATSSSSTSTSPSSSLYSSSLLLLLLLPPLLRPLLPLFPLILVLYLLFFLLLLVLLFPDGLCQGEARTGTTRPPRRSARGNRMDPLPPPSSDPSVLMALPACRNPSGVSLRLVSGRETAKCCAKEPPEGAIVNTRHVRFVIHERQGALVM